MAASYYVGDWGKVEVLTIAAGVDLTGCTGRLLVNRPDGATMDKVATLDIALRTITYTWIQTPLDIDQRGWWRVQGYATKAGVFVAHTDPADFFVGARL
jgi:hypothetical protein